MNPDDEKLKIRERLFKRLFLAGDRLKSFLEWIIRACRVSFIVTLFLFFITFIFYIGFPHSEETILRLRSTFRIFFLIHLYKTVKSDFSSSIMVVSSRSPITACHWKDFIMNKYTRAARKRTAGPQSVFA